MICVQQELERLALQAAERMVGLDNPLAACFSVRARLHKRAINDGMAVIGRDSDGTLRQHKGLEGVHDTEVNRHNLAWREDVGLVSELG